MLNKQNILLKLFVPLLAFCFISVPLFSQEKDYHTSTGNAEFVVRVIEKPKFEKVEFAVNIATQRKGNVIYLDSSSAQLTYHLLTIPGQDYSVSIKLPDLINYQGSKIDISKLTDDRWEAALGNNFVKNNGKSVKLEYFRIAPHQIEFLESLEKESGNINLKFNIQIEQCNL